MNRERTPINGAEVDLMMATANELRGRQSVRTTFKLSENTIHAVSIVSEHLGIKQKSLFDHLIDDINALKSMESTLGQRDLPLSRRIPKTYVISRRSLDSLDRASKAFHTSRDLLVEFSVLRLLPMIEAEQQQHEKRKEVLTELHSQTVSAKELWRKTSLLLGTNDFVSAEIEMAAKALAEAERRVADCVERGRIIEKNPFDTD